jgi:hypothetical protein
MGLQVGLCVLAVLSLTLLTAYNFADAGLVIIDQRSQRSPCEVLLETPSYPHARWFRSNGMEAILANALVYSKHTECLIVLY